MVTDNQVYKQMRKVANLNARAYDEGLKLQEMVLKLLNIDDDRIFQSDIYIDIIIQTGTFVLDYDEYIDIIQDFKSRIEDPSQFFGAE